MKNSFFFLASAFLVTGALLTTGCDKVTNPYPEVAATELDQTLYPGNWADYLANEWPVFTANTNTYRNVLIEDFTGHTCINCPQASESAEQIVQAHPGRVFVAAIHTGPTGMGPLQAVSLPDYPTDWTNAQGLEIGNFFGTIPGSAFQGNPRGTVNRALWNDQLTVHPTSWPGRTNSFLNANILKVNLQSHANYYPETRGLFLHTEVDITDASLTNALGLVVYLIQDSMVGDQKMSDNTHNHEYVHREIMRGCIDGQAFGRTISADDLNENGNYYLNYSYKLPAQYTASDMHVLIYVYDKTTYEVYQVIKQEFVE